MIVVETELGKFCFES